MTKSTSPLNIPPVPQHVTGPRIMIRPSARRDMAYLQKWWNDPDITEPGGNVSGMQYDDAAMEEWCQRYIDGRTDSTHFVICLTAPRERPIGEFYIASDDRPGSVGVALIIGERDLWGQGYAREALQAYADALFASGFCQAIRIDMRRDNRRAARLCEALGFEVEHVWANGLFQTMILTQEMAALRRSPQAQNTAVSGSTG